MKGVFLRKNFKSWLILLFVCGLFFVGLFFFLLFADSQAGNEVFVFLVAGISFIAVVVPAWLLNFNAFLLIGDGRILARYNWFGKIDCPLSDVDFVSAQLNALILELKDGRRHTLMGLKNAFEICFEIRKQLDFEANNDPKELSKMLRHRKCAGKKNIIAFSLCLILLVIVIAVPIFLIGNKEFHEFNARDWSIFGAMCAALLPSFIILIIFAIKARKCLLPTAKLLYTLNRTMIETTPLLPGRVMKIYADVSFNGRIVIYNAETVDSVYYSVEKMNSEYVLEHLYTSDFIKREEFSEDYFSGLIDITDRMLKTNGSTPPQ